MQVLVTGASGFVGSMLAEALRAQNHDVTLLMRKSSSRANLNGDGFRFVEGDLRDAASLGAAVRDAEVIFHVAGVISAVNRDGYFAGNAQGTANLAEAARRNAKKLKRFVYVSSLAAGGPAERGRPRVEADTPSPISIYGQSKLGGEEALRNLGVDFPSVIVRPPVVYGPRDRGMFTFFKIVKSGILPSIRGRGPDPGGYSFVHVDDLVQALMAVGFASKAWPAGEIFYAAGDGEYTWEETMRMMADAFEKKGLVLPIPLVLLKTVGTLAGTFGRLSGKNTAINTDKVKEIAVPYWTCSNEKIKKNLEFKPYWSVANGFQQTAAWYRDRGWL